MPHSSSTCFCCFLVLLTITAAPATPAASGDHVDPRFANCSAPFHCANIKNISYPFWGATRPRYCGHPAFRLDRSGEVPLINIMALRYRILEINRAGQSFAVSRADCWETFCPTPLILNTTVDTPTLRFSSDIQNITIYYVCRPLPPALAPLLAANSFSCFAEFNNVSGYWRTNVNETGRALAPAVEKYLAACMISVFVPVFRSAAREPTSLRALLNDGFGLAWDANNLRCEICVASGGYCGYISDAFTCYCHNGPFPAACGVGNKRNWILKTVAGTAVGVVGIVFVVVLLLRYYGRISCQKMLPFWKKLSIDQQKVEAFMKDHGALAQKKYTYAQVKRMTFSFRQKLGEGGYGSVFKGNLPNEKLVAVKVLSTTKGNGEEFINEVASISRTSHVNIVRLVGFCFEGSKRALIYEFMPNGSLEKFIYNDNSSKASQHLGWEKLSQIAIGIAHGLEYLHKGCNTRILHFDIKPHNILLDEDFCPKISDFGLSKLCSRKESMVSMMEARGTIGYIAPEVFSRNFGGVSYKSDVYSYGMMVLEMVGARRNLNAKGEKTSEIYFPYWIYKRFELNEDLGLQGIGTSEESDIVTKMVIVGLWCIQTDPSLRPSMTKVIDMFEGSLEALKIPPKPFLSSPTRAKPRSSSDINDCNCSAFGE